MCHLSDGQNFSDEKPSRSACLDSTIWSIQCSNAQRLECLCRNEEDVIFSVYSSNSRRPAPGELPAHRGATQTQAEVSVTMENPPETDELKRQTFLEACKLEGPRLKQQLPRVSR